jgi:hypothetical protein
MKGPCEIPGCPGKVYNFCGACGTGTCAEHSVEVPNHLHEEGYVCPTCAETPEVKAAIARWECYKRLCDEAGANWDMDDAPMRFLALYRDEAHDNGFIIQTFDTLADLKASHDAGRYLDGEFVPESEDFEPLWMLRSIHDLDEAREVKFAFTLHFPEETSLRAV